MKQFITGPDIEHLIASGERILRVAETDVVTSVAREIAENAGITIEVAGNRNSPQPAAASGAGTRHSFVPQFASSAAPAVSSPSSSGQTPPYDIDAWRRKFPILNNYIHVANCSQAPQSEYTQNAAQAYLESWNTMGMDWERWMEEIFLAKVEFAKIINADPSEIAVGTSVSELTSTLGSSLPLNTNRKKVVVTDAEFPTVGHIWLAHQKFGLQTQFIPLKNGIIDENDYDAYVDEQTLLTSICDVFYYNGFKQRLDRIIPKIHAKGSLVYVDAYQGIGTHPIDVKALDVDFLASGNLKYLCGIPGVAFLYVKKELIPHLSPAFTGWFGQENPFAFEIHNLDYASDARRFDNGTPPVLTAYIARAGMQLISDVGVRNIQAWTDQLSLRCIEGARARGLDLASPTDISIKAPTTAIRVPGDSHDVEHDLKEMGIIASARADVVRIAPHFFTRMEDIDYVLDCFVKVLHK